MSAPRRNRSEGILQAQQSQGSLRRQKSCITPKKSFTIVDDPCLSNPTEFEDEDADSHHDNVASIPRGSASSEATDEEMSGEQPQSTPVEPLHSNENDVGNTTEVQVTSAPVVPTNLRGTVPRKGLFHRVKNKIIPVIMTVGAARASSSAKPANSAHNLAASGDTTDTDPDLEHEGEAGTAAAAAAHGAAARKRFQRAVNRVSLVQKLDGQAIFNQIRAVRERREAAQAAAGGAGSGAAAGAVLSRLKLLLSSERTTHELAWLSYQPKLLEKEIERIREQQARVVSVQSRRSL
jgi:hypothetical protein